MKQITYTFMYCEYIYENSFNIIGAGFEKKHFTIENYDLNLELVFPESKNF